MHTDAVLPALTAGTGGLLAARWRNTLGRMMKHLGVARVVDSESGVTVVTGLEGAVNPAEPVTCSYCGNAVVSDDDHAVDCCWRPGTGGAR